jgi:serine/threonine protein phosphatase PrpC
MSAEQFETELAALVGRHSKLTSGQIVTSLERALDAAFVEAGEPEASKVRDAMSEALKAADQALTQFIAFEEDARYIMGNTNFEIVQRCRGQVRAAIRKA